MQCYDVCVIGGGINGAGIARDAAGRGLSVLLLEAGDLACATSSSSTKLIHGGLRYLEYFAFGLVRESLQERERLLSIAPHIIWSLDFVLPHDAAQRPYWMIRAGLFLYDHLTKRKNLSSSKAVGLGGSPLQEKYAKGIRYTDCWVQDARLVVLNAMSAAQKGATILTNTPCTGLEFQNGEWQIHLQGGETAKARAVINATGPWVRQVLDQAGLVTPDVPQVRLVKGSHIVIRRRHEGDQAYILQQPDHRIVFAIPFEKEFTLIGTTEEDFPGDPYQAAISDAEKKYLCAAYNKAFKDSISEEDVVWDYSGVRPLFDDGQGSATAVTRDYHLHEHKGVPLLSVFGGKLTTYRVVAEDAVNKIAAILGKKNAQPWTDKEVLPGGDIGAAKMDDFTAQQAAKYPWISPGLLNRYVFSYGTLMDHFLSGAGSLDDLGMHYGDEVYEAEIRYLIRDEWAGNVEDILWRRSKLGLHIDEKTRQSLEEAVPVIVREECKS